MSLFVNKKLSFIIKSVKTSADHFWNDSEFVSSLGPRTVHSRPIFSEIIQELVQANFGQILNEPNSFRVNLRESPP
jgi:hypothetical protein